MSGPPLEADVIVVGAGPAGMAALDHLLPAGRRVIWVDQSAAAGGQIWRGGSPKPWAQRLQDWSAHAGLQQLFGHAVIAATPATASKAMHQLRLQNLLDPAAPALRVQAPQILLATGARERFLPFPGWTLPGVSGAGGLQALVKQGWPIKSRKVVLAGTGPLLLASAESLLAAGADLRCVAEQAPRSALLRFAARLPLGKASQALGLGWRLRGLPAYRSGSWVKKALAHEGRLKAVVLSDGRSDWELPCDALGIGMGLLPNTELATLLGCRIEAGAIAVDQHRLSSVPGVHAAGECTGIGGADKALIDGHIAGLALLGRPPDRSLLRQDHVWSAFGRQLQACFELRPELLDLADAQTLVCRCEDVSLGALRAHEDWREAKLQTRCGMGACQGRICAPITETLLGWPAAAGRGQREPLQPAPLHCFLDD